MMLFLLLRLLLRLVPPRPPPPLPFVLLPLPPPLLPPLPLPPLPLHMPHCGSRCGRSDVVIVAAAAPIPRPLGHEEWLPLHVTKLDHTLKNLYGPI